MEAAKLKENQVYFRCSYHSPDMLVPEILTYFYIGKNLLNRERPGGADDHYFQESESYRTKGNFAITKDKSQGPRLLCVGDKHLGTICDLPELIRRLQELLVRSTEPRPK